MASGNGARDGKVHATAIVNGQPMGDRARCGWLYVQTTTDPSRVTCKLCSKLLEAGRSAALRRPVLSENPLSRVGSALIEIAGVPTAPAPPVLDPCNWATVCRHDGVDVHNRCGSCAICEHERLLERFADLAKTYRREQRREHDPSAPAFGSLAAALVALYEWQLRDRAECSQLGKMLDRMIVGQQECQGGRRKSMLDHVDDVVHVERAVELAFRDYRNPAHLTPEDSARLLMLRTDGVLRVKKPDYSEISMMLLGRDHVATADQLKKVVRHGRRSVATELAARNMIPQPKRESGLAEAIWERQKELGVCDV